MNDTRRQRIYDLFQRACELSGPQRQQVIDKECGDDTNLKEELYRLLARHDSGSNDLLSQDDFDSSHVTPMPQRIGRYTLQRVLGRGGMGVVYLGEQESPSRLVAIKLMSVLAASDKQRSRFELEADVLARLQHPGIAQIFDTGMAVVDGAERPFIAMEYVEGKSLLSYAAEHALDDRQRLKLLIELAEAVHHAHQKGVIHRDLKPANLMVNNEGRLKILDFGVACMTESDVRITTLRTQVGELVGTIPYMSPEQARGGTGQLDTRSDIYAVGVVAYQLLSGRPPYDVGQHLIHEALRVVQEQPPVPLSRITPRLGGDVEIMIGKALEKDPSRRYQAVTDFSADIQRFLEGEPILARPPSAVYRMRKFAQRNRTLVVGVASVVALLMVTSVVMSRMAWRVAQERDKAVQMQLAAEKAQQKAEEAVEQQAAISNFLQDVFAAGSPYAGRQDTTVRDALDLAAERMGQRLADQPESAIAVRMRLADTYFSLGEVFRAIEQMEDARQRAEAIQPPNQADLAAVYAGLGQLYSQAGQISNARECIDLALSLIDEPTVRGLPARALTLVNHGALLIGEGKFAEAVQPLEESLALRENEFGKDHPYTLTVRNNLAIAARKSGDLKKAKLLSSENMEHQRRSLGERHPNTITGIYNHADLMREMKSFEESEKLFRESLKLAHENLPVRHFLRGQFHSGLGELLRQQERYEEAESHLLLGLEILQEQLGDAHAQTKRARNRVVQYFEDVHQPDRAKKYR